MLGQLMAAVGNRGMLIGIDGQSYLLLSNPNPRMVLLVGGLRKRMNDKRSPALHCNEK
jgi:hypothetical protein